MGEGDLNAATEEQRPELSHLLALSDRVRRHETDACVSPLDIFSGLYEPRGYVIEGPTATWQCSKTSNLRTLLSGLELGPDKWWIAEDE